MSRSLLLCSGVLTMLLTSNPAVVFAGQAQATQAQATAAQTKSCRMEQQCHWENFKKICVWVKVCR